jgi:hypothetical protein
MPLLQAIIAHVAGFCQRPPWGMKGISSFASQSCCDWELALAELALAALAELLEERELEELELAFLAFFFPFFSSEVVVCRVVEIATMGTDTFCV